MSETIEGVDGCCGCGTCVGVCPSNAITLSKDQRAGVLVPHIDAVTCTQCGLCTEVCPVDKLRVSPDIRRWKSGEDASE